MLFLMYYLQVQTENIHLGHLHQKEEYNVMLLQVDSEFVEGERRYLILWGDCGIANFFIREKDLKAQDFSNILYNWDCS